MKVLKQITTDEARLFAALWFLVAVFIAIWETVRTNHAPAWMVEVTAIYSAAILGRDFIRFRWGGSSSLPPDLKPEKGTDPNV